MPLQAGSWTISKDYFSKGNEQGYHLVNILLNYGERDLICSQWEPITEHTYHEVLSLLGNLPQVLVVDRAYSVTEITNYKSLKWLKSFYPQSRALLINQGR